MQYVRCERVIMLGFPPVMCLQIGACTCAVLTADAVAPGESITNLTQLTSTLRGQD